MLEGIIIFTASPCKSLVGNVKGGFRILSNTFGRLYKASLFIAELKPISGILSWKPTFSSMSIYVSFSTLSKNLVVSFVLVKYV